MSTVYQQLNARLYKLSKQSEYVADFDCESIIESLKTEIFSLEPSEAISGLNSALLMINSLIAKKDDLYKNFVLKKTSKVISPDEYDNLSFESTEEYVSLPESWKESVNTEITVELEYYKINLVQLINFIGGADPKKNLVPKGNAAKKKEEGSTKLLFSYIHTNRLDDIKDLFDSLKKNKLISDDTKLIDLKKVFSERLPAKKIYWTGKTSSLPYFIKSLFKKELLNSESADAKWLIVRKLFTFSPNGDEIVENLKSQHKPKKQGVIIDKIVQNLVASSPNRK